MLEIYSKLFLIVSPLLHTYIGVIPSVPIEPHRRVRHPTQRIHVPSSLWYRVRLALPIIVNDL